MTDVFPSPDRPAETRATTRWSSQRVARLGFLIGRGLEPGKVARDPLIASTVGNVHRQAQRLGMTFRDASTTLPRPVEARFDAAAAKRGLSRDRLIRLLLVTAGSDDGLIDNILDDGTPT